MTHMIIQNVILWKRYIRHLEFNGKRLIVTYVGGNKRAFTLETEPTSNEISGYELELEDR